MRSSWLPTAAAAIGFFVVAFAIRLEQHHTALLYPDGYQYLLMARGISEHFETTTVLGPGGELFVPNADAAAKPMFPLVVALVHSLGFGWLTAAAVVTAAASAAVVSLTFLLASRLGGTWFAGAAAALAVVASPSLAFWSGFSGPDPLAQALVLAAAVALVYERATLGGVLLGLAVATRPELVVIALAALLAYATAFHHLRAAIRSAGAFALTLGLVVLILRPHVVAPESEFLWIAPVLVLACAAVAFLPRERAPLATVVLVAVAVAGFASAAGLGEIWREDWALVVAGLAGLGAAMLDPARSAHASRILAVAVVLGAVYWMKNPGSDRYFAILLPLVALLVGLGIAALVQRWRFASVPAAAAVVAVVALGLARMPSGTHDQDVFSRTAQMLEPVLSPQEALVTAAPDAYGFWLPQQPMRTMRPGASGLVLLDPAQRSYSPHLAARGKVVARVESQFAFSRPDGEIDAGIAVVVAGRVTQERRRPSG
jgi:hypothetical protein